MQGPVKRVPLCAAAVLAAAAAATSCRQVVGLQDLPPTCTDPLMIDDMEDGVSDICETNGRHGQWFTVGDGTSADLTPAGGPAFHPDLIPGGRGASRYAAHMTGSGFSAWGALMGFNLNVQGLDQKPYSASTTAGIKFWMKSNVPVYVSVTIPGTIAPINGGECVDTETKSNCNNHYSFYFSKPGAGWLEYALPYEALTQGDGTPAGVIPPPADAPAWNSAKLVGIQFAAPAGEAFDVWVDDIRFNHDCSLLGCLPTCTDPELPVACPATDKAPARCWPAGLDCGEEILDADMPGVWGTAPDDVWAVGFGGTIVHWDGSAWTQFASGSTEWLSVPWGSGADDVWVVGFGGTILHWNGSVWAVVPSGTTEDLFGVWGIGPDVWATGRNGTILRRQGSGPGWVPVPSPTTYTLIRVWGSAPDDVWAVGGDESSTQGTIIHWNGSEWSPAATTALPPLLGVWGSDSDHVWATGMGGTILRYDGNTWSMEPSGTTADLGTIWGSGSGDVWAVGDGGTTLHRDLSGWSVVPNALQDHRFVGVWASGPRDAWAVGLGGAVAHWDGVGWSSVVVKVPTP